VKLKKISRQTGHYYLHTVYSFSTCLTAAQMYIKEPSMISTAAGEDGERPNLLWQWTPLPVHTAWNGRTEQQKEVQDLFHLSDK